MTTSLKNDIQKADFNEMDVIKIASKKRHFKSGYLEKRTATHSPITKTIAIIATIAILIILISDFSSPLIKSPG